MYGLTENKQVTILLVVVAALLAVIIGIIVWQNNRIPDPTPGAVSSTADPAAGGTQNPATPAAGGEFDPATAPKVPADQTPEQYVQAYYELCSEGKYAEAYPMLPTATQAYYVDSAGFEQTLTGYGISGFTVQPQAEVDESTIAVVGVQQAQGMDFPYTWTFVKGDDGTWMCAQRAMGGTQ